MVSFRAFAVASGIVFALSAPLARAATAEIFDTETKTQIQSVITRQLDAFQHDDGPGAEAFAAPAIKERFPEPSTFLSMVKEHYAALIHPKSTSFGEVAPSPHGPLQKMTIVAADGTVWTAVYAFEKVDGEWKITACGLQKDETQQDI